MIAEKLKPLLEKLDELKGQLPDDKGNLWHSNVLEQFAKLRTAIEKMDMAYVSNPSTLSDTYEVFKIEIASLAKLPFDLITNPAQVSDAYQEQYLGSAPKISALAVKFGEMCFELTPAIKERALRWELDQRASAEHLSLAFHIMAEEELAHIDASLPAEPKPRDSEPEVEVVVGHLRTVVPPVSDEVPDDRLTGLVAQARKVRRGAEELARGDRAKEAEERRAAFHVVGTPEL